MKLPRRNFLHLTAGAAGFSAVWRVARAQGYPSRPVRIIVGFAPGQAIDIVTRIIGQWLSERLGQQFIIENRPGPGGNIATETVVRALPDGYTLLAIGSNNMINAHALRKAELQLYPRYRTGRERLRRAASDGGQSFISGQDGSRVHRLRQGPSGPNQFCFGGQRFGRPCDRRAVQNDDRRQHAACALSGSAAGADRSHWRTSACHVRQHALLHRTYQGRQAAPFGGDRHGALAGASRRSHTGRLRAGFRDERVGRYRRAEEHAGRNHQHAQPGHQRRPRRPDDQGTLCRAWRRSACTVAQRVRKAHRGRNREVGQSNQVLWREAGLIWAIPAQVSARPFHNLLPAMFVHEEGFWEGSTSESLRRPDCPGPRTTTISLTAWRQLMHREEALRLFDLRNFRSYVEADEGRNQQFAGDVIPTGRLIEPCK